MSSSTIISYPFINTRLSCLASVAPSQLNNQLYINLKKRRNEISRKSI